MLPCMRLQLHPFLPQTIILQSEDWRLKTKWAKMASSMNLHVGYSTVPHNSSESLDLRREGERTLFKKYTKPNNNNNNMQDQQVRPIFKPHPSDIKTMVHILIHHSTSQTGRCKGHKHTSDKSTWGLLLNWELPPHHSRKSLEDHLSHNLHNYETVPSTLLVL